MVDITDVVKLCKIYFTLLSNEFDKIIKTQTKIRNSKIRTSQTRQLNIQLNLTRLSHFKIFPNVHIIRGKEKILNIHSTEATSLFMATWKRRKEYPSNRWLSENLSSRPSSNFRSLCKDSKVRFQCGDASAVQFFFFLSRKLPASQT